MRMMRMTNAVLAVAALAVFLSAPEAFGGLDPKPDSFGVYFETQGNVCESTVPVFTPYHIYLLVMNPTAPIDAFECVVTRVGAPSFVLAEDLGLDAVDADATAGGFRVARPTPYPVQYGAVVLVDWTWMQLSPLPMYVHVGPGSEPLLPGGLPVLGHAGEYRLGEIMSGSDGFAVTCINTNCVTADEITSFGTLKGLFRDATGHNRNGGR